MDANFWSNLLQQVLVIVLPPLCAAAVAFVVAWIRKQEKLINADTLKQIENGARLAVQAAEQAGAAQLIQNKKVYALEWLQKWLESNKINVDVMLLDGLIEGAVLSEIKRWEDTPAPAAPVASEIVTPPTGQ